MIASGRLEALTKVSLVGSASLRRLPRAAWVVLLAALLYLPGIGRFGLWDPHEIRTADPARELAESASLGQLVLAPDTTVPDTSGRGRYARRPGAHLALPALGIELLGTTELGARLPLALVALAGVLAIYLGGAALFGARAGLFAAAVLALVPTYLLGARQLVGAIGLAPALAMSLGGLGRAAFSADPKRERLALAFAALGLWLGWASGGILLGVAVPLGALALGTLCDWGRTSRFGRALGAVAALATIAVAVAALTTSFESGQYSALLGGAVHVPAQIGFAEVLPEAGFGLFPWAGLGAFALGVLAADPSQEGRGPRLFVVAAALLGFAASTVSADLASRVGFPAVAAVALAIGAALDGLERGPARPALALAVAAATALVARDLFLAPEQLAAAHVTDAVKWPVELRFGPAFLGFGLAFAGVAGALLAAPGGRVRRHGVLGLYAAGLATAAFLAFVSTPRLSEHLSFKALFDRYHALARQGEPLAALHVSGHGVNYYAGGKLEQLGSHDALAAHFGKGCAFALVQNEQLGAIDQALVARGVAYNVADASSSRFLLLSSCPQVPDQNPLRRFVSSNPPTPARTLAANFEDKVELLGVDFPAQASRARDGKVPITLHFRVKASIPGAYKIFLHLDNPGGRVLGDHTPLDGKLPTNYWSPGRYVTDRYEVDIPLMTTSAGVYTVYMGFFLGERRLKVLSGPNDGADRVNLGTIHIR